jgi:5-methylcytosine-specific restriction protein A
VFVRDGYVCQRTGVLCAGKYPAPNSPVANHKKPHRGDLALFWDEDNVETVSKAVHDSVIQAEEQAVPTGVWN